MTCPRCNSGAVVSGACASCGYGVSYGPRRRTTGSAPYQRRSATSRAGAVAVAPKVSSQTGRIVAWLQEHGSATRMEIKVGTGLEVNVVTARVNAALYPKKGPRLLRSAGTRECSVTGFTAEVIEVVPTQGGLL